MKEFSVEEIWWFERGGKLKRDWESLLVKRMESEKELVFKDVLVFNAVDYEKTKCVELKNRDSR